MKQTFILLLFIFLLYSCKTIKHLPDARTTATPVLEELIVKTSPVHISKGFTYKIPSFMESSGEEKNYNFDELLVEKGTNTISSKVIIAIRHTDKFRGFDLNDFSFNDQTIMKTQVSGVNYEDDWIPAGLRGKEIPYMSYQFRYNQGENIIYQRSVYIKYIETFYIISLSSRNKNMILNERNDEFWLSINID